MGGVTLVTLYIRGYLHITLLSWMWVYSDKWEQDKLRRRKRQEKGVKAQSGMLNLYLIIAAHIENVNNIVNNLWRPACMCMSPHQDPENDILLLFHHLFSLLFEIRMAR